jgi:probable HAF family extracellular repeat protein
MADLGTLGGTYSSAYAIYNHSQIVGDINDNGQITGYAGTGGDSTTMMRGFLYSNGVMTDLGNLGNPLTNVVPLAINNKGQIVGNISGYSTSSHAFLYNSSTMSLLDNLIDPGSGWNLVHDAAAITGSRFYRAVQP